ALALLRRHPDEVDALVALELLPADMPLAALSGWLHGSVSALRQGARAAQVERNLAKTDSLALRAQLGEERRQPVTIKPGTLCAVCGKRIGTTVFARYPSGIVAHFAC
ncbi:vacuolar sorting protein 39, partial [Pavlovales sp. CCMP2436]